MKKTLVISHAGCNDGFAAAWCAWKRYGDRADYVFCQHGDNPPCVKDREVFMLDFTFPPQQMEKIADDCLSLMVIDHHDSGVPRMERARLILGAYEIPPVFIFSKEHSAARMCWDYFQGHISERPALIDYVEDRDLWNHELPFTKEINAYLQCQDHDFDWWTQLAQDLNRPVMVHNTITGEPPQWRLTGGSEKAADRGKWILKAQAKQIEKAVQSAIPVEMFGYRVPATNCTNNISEVGHELALNHPFGVCWFVSQRGDIVVSLRSRENGVDVDKLAESRGGGGHKKAASMRVGRADAIFKALRGEAA